jgi:hypothetical protein
MRQILESEFYLDWGELLASSFRSKLGKVLIQGSAKEQADSVIKQLFNAPFVLVSHGVEDDPVFNFANQKALDLFEMSWSQFTQLASRKSAEPVARSERARLLSLVTNQGYIDDYSGVRISASGKRFEIQDAIVWNVLDDDAKHRGQAAMFSEWRYL